ncbi:MAG: TldD/PmbA family protein [Chloroflexi bacterium]|nr:TldD/PmbA family protein [Chloroflexota bacterium]
MLGERAALTVLERVLAHGRGAEVEALLVTTDSSLTRFANSAIHQNVSERSAELRVRVITDRRTGVASTNDLSDGAVRAVVERALEIARRQPEQPELAVLPSARPARPVRGFSERTSACSPAQRARSVKTVCDLSLEQRLNASGAFSTSTHELAIGSTAGVSAYDRHASAHVKTVIMGDSDASGYAERTAVDIDDIDFEELAHEAISKTLDSANPLELAPGEYPVVLEEYAVGEILAYLSYMGFGALAHQEGSSFLAGRLGEQVMSPSISIWDDGADPAGLPAAIDFEGTPKERVSLVERGVARGVVYDTATARREGRSSTGHSLPAPNTTGPFAWNLFMAPGEADRSALARGIQRGVWVTRLHYVNVLHPRLSVLTGMTRDGTFLIEHGERTRPVRSFRFTQSVLDSWRGVSSVSRQRRAVEAFMGVSVVPALAVDRFTFTGVSALPS